MARRVNTKFLTILLLILVGVGGAIFLATELIHEHPDHLVALGQQAAKEHKWQDAVDDFAKAASLSPRDPALQLMLGEALGHMVQTDPEAERQQIGAYQRALEINPKYLPALRALSELFRSAVVQAPDAGLYRSAIDYTQRARELDPSDEGLASLPDRLVIQEWAANLETDPKDVEKALKELVALRQKYPADPELPFTIASARLEQGRRLAIDNPSRNQSKEVTDSFNQATAAFESVLTGKDGGSQDRNAGMHYRFAQILEHLGGVDQSAPDAMKKDQDRAVAEITRARALAKEDDPRYVDINEYAAAIEIQRGDRAAAAAIYRKMPESPEVQLDLADLLGRAPDTRDEAEHILKSALASLPDDPNHIALYGMRFRMLLTLANLQVMNYVAMADSPARNKLHDEVLASLDKLDQTASFRIILPLKEVEARLHVRAGPAEEMEEVQTLSKLISVNPAAAKDLVLQMLLAEGYEETNQRANALGILRNLEQQFEREGQTSKAVQIQVKEKLVELLLTEQPDQVPARLDELEKLDPGDVRLKLDRLQWMLLDPEKYKEQIKGLYGLIGEDTVPLLMTKARVALQIRDYVETERLLNATIAKDPKDVGSYAMLARVLYTEGKKDEALAAANRGLAANPGDPRLRMLIPALKGESPKVLEDLQAELAKENPDKVQGELVQAGMASGRGDSDAEETHLKAAEKLAPESPRIQDLLFNLYLKNKRFPEAAQCIPILAKGDYDRAGGALYKISLYEAQRDIASAEKVARQLVVDRPEYSGSWLALGDVLQNEGLYDQAIPQYLQCRQKQSNLPDAYIGTARCYYALHKPDDALQTIEQGLSRMPDNRTLQQLKLTHELNYGQPADAVAEIEAELRARPDQPELYAAMAEVLLRYSAILQSNNQADDALKEAQQAINELTDPLAKWPNESELYIAMSQAQMVAKHPEDALKTLEHWASLDAWKGQPDPYIHLADLYERTGNYDKAEDELHTAMARSGYRVDMQIRMASMLALHRKYNDALQLLRAVNSDKPAVREKIVQILLVAGNFDEAQTELKTDLAKQPPDSELLLQVWAMALYERKLDREAVERATEALAQDPKDLTALYCRGRARLEMRPPDAAGALQDLTQVRQYNTNNVEVRLYIADANVKLNQYEEAISQLEAALRLEPKNKQVRMRLVDLYVTSPHPRVNEALRLLQEIETIPPFDKDASVFQTEAVILSKGGDNNDALAKSEMALRLAPDDPSVVRTNMQILQIRKDYQGVIDHYASMSDKWKKSSWALADLGIAEKRLNSDQALPHLKQALAAAVDEDDPPEIDQIAQGISAEFGPAEAINAVMAPAKDHLSAKLTLAHLYQGRGDDAQALATMDEIMTHFDKLSHRDQVNTLASAAILYQLAKPAPLVDKAYDAYQQWLKLEPDNLEALNNMACLLADNYSPPRAKEGLDYANRAIAEMSRLGRTEPRLLDTQGWLMILNGTPEDGVHTLNTAMTQFAPFPDEYLHLGEGYLRMERPDPVEAETQAKLGLRLVNKQNGADSNDPVRAKLQDLINRSEEMRHPKQQAQVP
jgi:tetratricopeptide (TPR) repeat protein